MINFDSPLFSSSRLYVVIRISYSARFASVVAKPVVEAEGCDDGGIQP